MPKPLSSEEFSQRIAAVQRSALRLELQRQYRVPAEEAFVARFLAGDRSDPFADSDYFARWLETVRGIHRRGGRMERVRVHDDPPTDYQRWERWAGRWNIDAGETIRYLTRAQAHEIGLLPDAGDVDWWLLDDTDLITMYFDSHGNGVRTELVTDPAAVAQARKWWELAAAHGVPDPGRTAVQGDP